jgi:hypothetical protein
MLTRIALSAATLLLHAESLHAADVILNEYNAVGNGLFLEGDGEDTFWGRIEENGGDWFELVVVTDHLDMRGWQLVISDDVGDDITLALTENDVWADLRSGTIITISEELENNVEDYSPAVGGWWLNVKAAANTDGTFMTAADFRVNNNNWQLTIRDAAETVVFGPAGEGINPITGVNGEEVLKLEAQPTEFITRDSNYQDGQSSTFGSPNLWNGGTESQDFTSLRSVVPYFPLTTVRINEVLTHTDLPTGDWVELYNTTDEPIDVGGWYLSDDVGNLTMFRIASDTSIPAQGYLVFSASELNFALSAVRGDEVYLSEAHIDGQMTGARDFIEVGPAPNGVSFGRYPDGSGSIYPMVEATKGAANSEPLVGPVVVNEIMYNPLDLPGGADNTDHEFVELRNITNLPVSLWTHFADVDEVHPWKLAGGVRFDFSLDTEIAACGYLVVVRFDPSTDAAKLAGFRETYGLPETVSIVGPYEGKLSNSGETLEIRKPDPPQEPGDPEEGTVPYVLVDGVPYSNRSPWPAEAAGQGFSLERLIGGSVGDVSSNWAASDVVGGTPGAANSNTDDDDCQSQDTTQPPADNDGDSEPSGSDGRQARPCGFLGLVDLAWLIGGLFALRLYSVRMQRSCARSAARWRDGV